MKTRIIKYFGVLFLSMLVLTTINAQSPRQDRFASLELTEEQQAEITALRAEHYKAITPLKNKMAELKARNNARHIVFPRQVAMFLSKRLTDKSLPAIGAQFDKHHTTVIHAIRKIEKMRGKDRDIDRILTTLEEELS